MTTRKGFFTALLAIATAAIAKAQQTIITPCRPKIQWGGQIPLCNGQCPNGECGYRAPPFPQRPNEIAGHPEWGDYQKAYGWPIGRVISEFTPGDMYAIPVARLNRCPNCNTAFWQDPQEEKG